MLLDSNVPFTELQHKLYTHLGVVYYCENAPLLRHRSEHTCASTIYSQTDFITKTLHCKAKFAIS